MFPWVEGRKEDRVCAKTEREYTIDCGACQWEPIYGAPGQPIYGLFMVFVRISTIMSHRIKMRAVRRTII